MDAPKGSEMHRCSKENKKKGSERGTTSKNISPSSFCCIFSSTALEKTSEMFYDPLQILCERSLASLAQKECDDGKLFIFLTSLCRAAHKFVNVRVVFK